MKAYTDLEQSKTLSKILPLESADFWWAERYAGRVENYEYIVEEKPVYYLSFQKPSEDNYSQDTIKNIPCWSLAALLDVLPDELQDNHYLTLEKEKGEYCCCYEDTNGNSFKHTFAGNPVDACYEMIIKLHEQKLLCL